MCLSRRFSTSDILVNSFFFLQNLTMINCFVLFAFKVEVESFSAHILIMLDNVMITMIDGFLQHYLNNMLSCMNFCLFEGFTAYFPHTYIFIIGG